MRGHQPQQSRTTPPYPQPPIAKINHKRRILQATTITLTLLLLATSITTLVPSVQASSVPDRSRITVQTDSKLKRDQHRPRNNGRPIEGNSYRHLRRSDAEDSELMRGKVKQQQEGRKLRKEQQQVVTQAAAGRGVTTEETRGRRTAEFADVRMSSASNLRTATTTTTTNTQKTTDQAQPSFLNNVGNDNKDDISRGLASQLTGCCYDDQGSYAADICGNWGEDCESGNTGSGDQNDDEYSCSQDGLSFIGISFSVNTANGNPYSYQLCDQFAMEGIIDRPYDFVMSMDEDGWLVGGGYKTFDYSGKMPYIDSSHTELVRIGSMDPDKGGTSIDVVYDALSSISFSPVALFPEYLKAGGGHNSGDEDYYDEAPSGDVTLVVSIIETYNQDENYSDYEQFLDDLFEALTDAGGGPCMDDKDTDPHVSMSRGVKFKSSTHQTNYMYQANLEVAVWQSMYPNGVVLGSPGYASFPPGKTSSSRKTYVGYGSLYFFFDRANITRSYQPSVAVTDDQLYYSQLMSGNTAYTFYEAVTDIDFDYGGSGDQTEYTHNPYAWNAGMAKHDMTDGWSLPPNCYMEGETFLGIPLAKQSDSKMQSTTTFQNQFDFDGLMDLNYTYVDSFETNHGWLLGEEIGNAIGNIVDKDTAHIPIFYTGTTNADMGGISISNLIKIVKNMEFGNLYIKPAFVFVDEDGHLKMQFEADSTSALGYLYDSLCKELGIAWSYNSPSNTLGVYSNCAMHAAGDRAAYGCGPSNSNEGGFCPQMTIAYGIKFKSEEYAATYMDKANNYVDYWRSIYPTGVAVGTDDFCKSGGCLGLFLNRADLYSVFKPDLAGSWVQYNGASMAPTYSPAPTWSGGCNEPHNFHLDKCFQRKNRAHAAVMAWDSLGSVGQLSVFVVSFMAVTLALSLFVARARKKRRKGESYTRFFLRDTFRLKKKRKKSNRRKKSLRRKLKGLDKNLEESMLDDNRSRRSRSGRSRSRGKSSSSRRSRSSRKGLEAQTVTPSSAHSVKSDRSKRSRSRSKR